MAYEEVCTVINFIPILMLAFAGGLFWRYDSVVAFTYIFCVGLLIAHLQYLSMSLQACYLYAMYVEFGISEILEPSPLIYAITHQVELS